MRAALFGSRARGDNRPDSDIDIMIEIEPEKAPDLMPMSASNLASRRCFPSPSMSSTATG
jgi:uncharacterized protein